MWGRGGGGGCGGGQRPVGQGWGTAVKHLLAPWPGRPALLQIVGYRREMLKYTDQRVKLMNQLLVGIRVLKMYAWEVSGGGCRRRGGRCCPSVPGWVARCRSCAGVRAACPGGPGRAGAGSRPASWTLLWLGASLQ